MDLGPGEGAIRDPFYSHAQAGSSVQGMPFFLIDWYARTSQGSQHPFILGSNVEITGLDARSHLLVVHRQSMQMSHKQMKEKVVRGSLL